MEISALGCPTFYGISDVPSLMNFPSSWCDPQAAAASEDVIQTIRYTLCRSRSTKAITDGSSVSTRHRTSRRDDASRKSQNEVSLQRRWSRILEEEASVQLRVLSEEESRAEEKQEGPTNVLSLPMMKGLQKHFPFSKRGESFWLQYSLVRDGASLDILLSKVKDSGHTLLAIETTEGEIFGAFTTEPWKVSHDYYGSGQSFLWRIDRESWLNDKSYRRHHHHSSSASVRTSASSRSRRRHHPSVREHLQVFKFGFTNHCIQYCRPDRLILGGGTSAAGPVNPEWGFGLWLDHELYRGSSSPCATFQSPSLSSLHADGTPFEIRNLEVWALTPCLSLQDAERSQRHRRLMANSMLPKSLSFRRKRNHIANNR